MAGPRKSNNPPGGGAIGSPNGRVELPRSLGRSSAVPRTRPPPPPPAHSSGLSPAVPAAGSVRTQSIGDRPQAPGLPASPDPARSGGPTMSGASRTVTGFAWLVFPADPDDADLSSYPFTEGAGGE